MIGDKNSPAVESYLSTSLATWNKNKEKQSALTYDTNVTLLSEVISNPSIDNEQLAHFILDCKLNPEQAAPGGMMNSYVVKALQTNRHAKSFKEFFGNLKPCHGFISVNEYMKSGQVKWDNNKKTQAYESNARLLTEMIATQEVSNEQLADFLNKNLDSSIKEGKGLAYNKYVVEAIKARGANSVKDFIAKHLTPAAAKPKEAAAAPAPAMLKAEPKPVVPDMPKVEKKPAAEMPKEAAKEKPVVPIAAPIPAKPQVPFTSETLLSRPGHHKPIVVDIANVKHLAPLTYEKFDDLFALLNEHTLNKTYPCQNTSKKIAGKWVHRANHNGTHSARQVRCMEAIVDCINKHGNQSSKELLKQYSPEEMLHLKLAAYLMRAGRVDESEHDEANPDNYNERSAQVYEKYARQLTTNDKLITDTRNIIEYSCVPWSKCPKIQGNKKAQLGHSLLASIHELDLLRCYPPEKIDDNNIPATKSRLKHLGITSHQVDNLYEFSKKTLDSTGSFRVYDGKEGNSQLFADCSVDGKKCWQQVSAVPFLSDWNK